MTDRLRPVCHCPCHDPDCCDDTDSAPVGLTEALAVALGGLQFVARQGRIHDSDTGWCAADLAMEAGHVHRQAAALAPVSPSVDPEEG